MGTNFAKELFELVRVADLVGRLDAGLPQGLLQEFGHLYPDFEQLAFLLVLFATNR